MTLEHKSHVILCTVMRMSGHYAYNEFMFVLTQHSHMKLRFVTVSAWIIYSLSNFISSISSLSYDINIFLFYITYS